MLKEIYEQPAVIRETLDGRVRKTKLLENAFGVNAPAIFDKVKHVQFVACGTSYHACHVAKYWLESIARMECSVDIDDYLYQDIIVPDGSLLVTVSQSGELQIHWRASLRQNTPLHCLSGDLQRCH